MTDRGKPHLTPTRLDAVVTALESLMAHGYFLHGADGVALDRDGLYEAMRVALDAGGKSNQVIDLDLAMLQQENERLRGELAISVPVSGLRALIKEYQDVAERANRAKTWSADYGVLFAATIHDLAVLCDAQEPQDQEVRTNDDDQENPLSRRSTDQAPSTDRISAHPASRSPIEDGKADG